MGFLSFSRALGVLCVLDFLFNWERVGSTQPNFHSSLKHSMVLALTKAPISAENRVFQVSPANKPLHRANEPLRREERFLRRGPAK